jgi:hypothetical protein
VKNYTPIFLVLASIYSFGCFAQDKLELSNSKTKKMESTSGRMADNELVIVSYRVEERINMNFGGYVRTYNVANLSLVSNNELGPNNTRVITPIYGRAKAEVEAEVSKVAPLVVMTSEPPKAHIEIKKPLPEPIVDAVVQEKKNGTANVDILKTYERVLDKGYKSVEMLKKVANRRFFDGDMVMAAKWYAQLFDQATDLDAVFYYRYAESLKAIKQIDKSNEMMAIFNQKKTN